MWVERLFLALLIIAVVQAVFFRYWNFKSLTYKRYFSPDTLGEGETAEMIEIFRNEKLLPIPWIKAEAQISENLLIGSAKRTGEKQYHRSLFSLPPYTTITRRHKVYCAKRGYYHIKSVSITSGDMLGIGVQKSIDIDTDSVITVYPKLIPIDEIFNMTNSYQGDTVVRRWIMEDPFMIRGAREYTTSDPQNHINWKATARTGRLQVNDYDFTAEIKLLIAVNVDTSPNQWSRTTDENAAEYVISAAASIAQHTLSNGIETGLMSNGKIIDDPETPLLIEPHSSEEQLTYIFTALSKLTLDRVRTFPTSLLELADSGITGCDILLVTAYSDEFIEEQADRLRSRGNNACILTVRKGENAL